MTSIGAKGRWLRRAYSLLLRLAVPFYLLRLRRRGRLEPLYREHLGERLGVHAGVHSSGWVWIHAVSLGETRAAAPLIDALRIERPGMALLLTHGTATGREAGAELLQDGDRQAWLPFDTPGAVRRFLDHFTPAVGVLVETEIWPNLLLAAQARKLPMVLASARLSERSQRRGRRVASVMQPVAASFALVLAQTADDAKRLRLAGALRVEVDGNLKFDLAPDPVLIARGQAWRALVPRPVVLAAVTRDSEESMLLAAWKTVAAPRPLLVIVPRHPQRFDHVAGFVDVAGLICARRSSWTEVPPAEAAAVDVWLGDSMREMPAYYAMASVALLGGSFAKLGGQNLIEAAACGCPVIMGPHTFNFTEAADRSLDAGASLRVADMAAGVEAAVALVGDPDRLASLGEAALRFAAQHRGAAQRMARRIAQLLPQT